MNEKESPCKVCKYGKFYTIQCICEPYRIWKIELILKRLKKETEDILKGKTSILQKQYME